MPTERLIFAGRPLATRLHRSTLIAAAGAALAVAAVIGLATTGWIGRPFPGFFVLPNGVVPSVGREVWPAGQAGVVFQRIVVAVDGQRVFANADTYREVSRHLPGTDIVYTLRHGSTTEQVTFASRTFTTTDYWVIFGSYLLTGLLYLLLGLLGSWLLPDASLGRALLMVGGVGGIYAFTGASIYQAGADLRLHALAEAFFPATLVYLALVCAKVEGRLLTILGALAWWLSLALAIPYQLLLAQPVAYSLVHAACETYLGLAGLVVGATLVVERAQAAEHAGPLLRAAVAGALLGIGVPAVIMLLSGLSGGLVPVNLTTATAFMFPLCLAYGLVREQGLRAPVVSSAPA